MEKILSLNDVLKKSGTGNGMIAHTETKKYLRHTHPVLGVDKIVDHSFENGWVHSVRAISCSQPIFQGHFPDEAIYPGTNLIQDIIQIAIIAFIGSTRPLNDGKEITVVTDIISNLGHPISPGNLLDIGIWYETPESSTRSIHFNFESRVKDFPYYSNPNKYGMTFSSAMTGECTIKRVNKKIYQNIGF